MGSGITLTTWMPKTEALSHLSTPYRSWLHPCQSKEIIAPSNRQAIVTVHAHPKTNRYARKRGWDRPKILKYKVDSGLKVEASRT